MPRVGGVCVGGVTVTLSVVHGSVVPWQHRVALQHSSISYSTSTYGALHVSLPISGQSLQTQVYVYGIHLSLVGVATHSWQASHVGGVGCSGHSSGMHFSCLQQPKSAVSFRCVFKSQVTMISWHVFLVQEMVPSDRQQQVSQSETVHC